MNEKFGELVMPMADKPEEEGTQWERELREGKGRFLCLETYIDNKEGNTAWSSEVIARDALQNFYDADGGTLDNIHIQYGKNETGEDNILIEGQAEYPYQRLTSFGATYKKDRKRAAGGKGEGAKVLALQLLRDHGASKVIYGSNNPSGGSWTLEFKLDAPPEGSLDEEMNQDTRGLYAKLRTSEQDIFNGNFVSVMPADQSVANEFVKARDLFYHNENEDFKGALLENEHGGIRFLGNRDSGNFYLNGQRVHYNYPGKWQTLSGFTMWSKETPEWEGKSINIGRDRLMVSPRDVQDVFIPWFINTVEDEDAQFALLELEHYFKDTFVSPDDSVGQAIVKSIVAKLAAKGIKMEFDDRFLANDTSSGEGNIERYKKDRLEAAGYILCHAEMSQIGMRTVETMSLEMEALYEIEATESEKEKMRLLENITREFLDFSIERGHYQYPLEFQEIKLSRSSMLGGLRRGSNVYLTDRIMHHTPPYEAFETYIHELCHTYGSDESSTFSDALTRSIGNIAAFIDLKHDRWVQFRTNWEQIKSKPLTPEEAALGLQETIDSILISDEASSFSKELEEMFAGVEEDIANLLGKTDGRVVADSLIELYEEIAANPALRRMNEVLHADTRNTDEIQRQIDELREQQESARKKSSDVRIKIQSLRNDNNRSKQWKKKARKETENLKTQERMLTEQLDDYAAQERTLRAMSGGVSSFLRLEEDVKKQTIRNVTVDVGTLQHIPTFLVGSWRAFHKEMRHYPEERESLFQEMQKTTQQLNEKNGNKDLPPQYLIVELRRLRQLIAEPDVSPGDIMYTEYIVGLADKH